MDGYKKKLDSIHAPESLIAATLSRIHEEEAPEAAVADEQAPVIEPFKARRKWLGFSAITAAAAVLAVVIGLNMNAARLTLTYGTVPDTLVRVNSPYENNRQIELREYSELIGFDVEGLLSDADIIKSVAYAETANGLILADECAITYDVNGKPLTLLLSATQDVFPEGLGQLAPSEIGGVEVYAAVSESGRVRIAGFRLNECSFLLSGSSMDSEQFEDLVRELIKNF